MKLMLDIPHEEILKAAEAIQKKKGICKILPRARFHMLDGRTTTVFAYLICDDRMEGKQTGDVAEHCKNCLLKER